MAVNNDTMQEQSEESKGIQGQKAFLKKSTKAQEGTR